MIMPRGRKTILMLASIAGVVALAAAGCSSSSKSSSGTTATTAAPATSASTSPAGSTGATTGSTGSTAGGTADGVGEPLSTPTGTPFNLGYICLCGQLNANATLNPAVLRAWVTWQNLHGGVNGHPVHLSYFNDPGNPGVALLQVQKMVNSDHIVALIDGDSADDASWYSYIIKQPVTIYNTGFSSLPMASSTSPNVFEMAVSQYYLFDEIMLSAQKVGGHKMAVLYCAENPACKETVAPLTAAGKQFNIPVVFNASVLASAPNYTAQCLAAKAAGADVMFIADGPAVTISVAASCAEQGYTPHQVSDEAAYSQQMAGKPGWDGFLGTQDNIPFFVTSTPGSETMHKALQQYQPSVLASPQFSALGPILWNTGLLIAQGAQAGGVGATNPVPPVTAAPLTGTALVDGLYTMHTTDLGGMTYPLTFVRGQLNQKHCWYWAGIAKGQWDLPFGLTTTCAPLNPS
jgi:branched-chain amino acid transport system substrate-binding protein